MWASKTDYAGLYTEEYFGKKSGVASFDIDILPSRVSALCAEMRCKSVVDIGSGSGILADRLGLLGIEVLPCDYAPSHSGAIHLDLSSEDGLIAGRARETVRKRPGFADFLVTCFDVFEHIDTEDIAAAVSNLRRMTQSMALVSISTRPSSSDNAYHATIVPLPTWVRILESAGFEVVDSNMLPEARRVLSANDSDPNVALVAHWIRNDPFRDVKSGEPNYILIRVARSLDVELVRRVVDRLLVVSHRRRKRRQVRTEDLPRIALNIHHIQDFFTLRPLLDIFRRDQVVCLLRAKMLRADERSLVRGFFRRCGLSVVEYQAAAEIDWQGLGIERLVSGSESTVTTSHILSRHLIEEARLRGVPSILLQHGIWVDPYSDRPIEFGSDRILTWGHEHEAFFNIPDKQIGRHVGKRGRAQPGAFEVVGSPGAWESRNLEPAEVLRSRLGLETSGYESVAILGTNLLWYAHQVGRSNTIDQIRRVIDSNSQMFFIVKTHPSERAQNFSDLRAENSFVIDDIIRGCIDLSVPQLISGVDIVISSLSTLLLDGAAAGKKCVQYDTGNTFKYEACEPIPLSRLAAKLDVSCLETIENDQFVDHYADADHQQFYAKFAAALTGAASRDGSSSDLVNSYGLTLGVEECWRRSLVAPSDIGGSEPVNSTKAIEELKRAEMKLKEVESFWFLHFKDLLSWIEDARAKGAAAEFVLDAVETHLANLIPPDKREPSPAQIDDVNERGGEAGAALSL